MKLENVKVGGSSKDNNLSIYTVRDEKNAPEQAACWQCDCISTV